MLHRRVGLLAILVSAALGACTPATGLPANTAPATTAAVNRGAVQFNVSSSLKNSYRQGERGAASFNVSLTGSSASLTHATAFLNLVQETRPGHFAQVMHQIFADAAETPPLFRVPMTAQTLAAGVSSTLDFVIRPDAPPGNYILVVQVFPGQNSDPNTVIAAQRLGFRAFPIEITR